MLTTTLGTGSRSWPQAHRVHAAGLLSGVLLLAGASMLPAPRAASADAISGEWQLLQAPPPPPAPLPGRTSHILVLDTARDRLIAFGGDPGPQNDVWVFPLPAGPGWTKLETVGTPPARRYGASAVYDPIGDRMILLGGYTGSWPGDLWQLSLSGDPTWTQLSPNGQSPPARQDAATIYDPVGKQMIVFGGATTASDFKNDAWALSLDTPGRERWSRLTPSGTPPTPRDLMGVAYDSQRQRMILFGGWDASHYLTDTWALDFSRARPAWAQIRTASAPSARREAMAVYDPAGDRMVLFGGVGFGPIPPWSYEYLGDTWQLNLGGTPNWTRLEPSGAIPSPRGNGRTVFDAARQRMLLVGGYDLGYRGDVNAFALIGPPAWSLVWSDAPAGGTIEAHRDYAAVYDPDDHSELMFGGTESYYDTNDMWRLDLDGTLADWGLVQAGSGPSPRHGHRGVWDPVRHRAVFFGGYSSYVYSSYLNDVWTLTPSPSPTWVHHTTAGSQPTPRMLCGMGYDPVRDRIIVVGGHGGFTSGNPPYMNDVWALSLPGMQWTQVAVGGTPPSPRWIYGMRYDPVRDRFLFFGGVTELGRPNDVWALNLFGSPAWQQLTPSGVPPSGRSDHAMVYDPVNDRMVVFGGFDGAFRNDVWALNLAGAPSWSQLAPAGASPLGRDIIDAIYDPGHSRMIVYGGWSGSEFLNDTWALSWASAASRRIESPMPASVALPEANLVQLVWTVPRAGEVQASVERRGAGGEWLTLGPPAISPSDRVIYEDRSAEAGAHYEYRLRVARNGQEAVSAVSRIDVPSGYALELAGAWPNPAVRELWVSLTLPRGDPAKLELLDVSGRLIAARDVGDMGAGRHRVRLGEGSRLTPGVYVIRLASGARAITRKALVVQ
jgi:galactose oxidase-like protein/Kelch motif protein